MPDVTAADILGFLKTHALDIAKLVEKDFTAADVHATTALGNGDTKPKPKSSQPFAALIAQAQAAKKPAGDDDVGKGEHVDFGVSMVIAKQLPDERKVWGWASVATVDGKAVVDKQDDVIEPGELRKAAHDFVMAGRPLGNMHTDVGVGRIFESVMFDNDLQKTLGIDLGMEGWFVGFKVDDDGLWDKIKSGEQPEFSIGGRATRVPI